jgi:NADH-quinone oxidoreductase subunit J
MHANIAQWILGFLLILASLGVILSKKPVYSALSFLATLMLLASLYLQLSAQFIAVMQILVYAGAILVLFMFVIILFQDAHSQISKFEPQSSRPLLIIAGSFFIITLIYLGKDFISLPLAKENISATFGTVQNLGTDLYIDFFFPFEAVILLFLIALVGAIYTAKKEKIEATKWD